LTSAVCLLGILAVAKTPFPVKAKLWVRELMIESEEKHAKTKQKPLQKIRGALAS
jgi:hypothetical protein